MGKGGVGLSVLDRRHGYVRMTYIDEQASFIFTMRWGTR